MELAETFFSEVEKYSLLNDKEHKNDGVEELHIKEDHNAGTSFPSLMNDMQGRNFDTSFIESLASDSCAVPMLDHEIVRCNFRGKDDIVIVELLAAKEYSTETSNRDNVEYENKREGSNKKFMEEKISLKSSIHIEKTKEVSRPPVTRV